ncbi:DUF748 domain-containing protein [Thalassotalea piscium]
MINILLKAAKYFVTFIFILFILIWLLSPPISSHFIQKQLTPQSLVLGGQSHVRYNPFLSKLSVENLVITKNKSIVLAIKKLEVGVSLYQLLLDRIYIKQFDLDGLFIKIRQDKQREEIAGFSLTPTKAQPSSPEQSSAEDVNYELVLPLLKIQNAKIGYESNDRKLEFIATYLNTKNLIADSKKQSGEFELIGKVEQGTINFSGNFDMLAKQGVIESAIDITQLDLSLFSPWLPKIAQLNSGLVNLSSQQKVHLIDEKTEIALANFQLQIAEVDAAYDNLSIAVDKQELYSPKLNLIVTEKDGLKVAGEGQYTLDRLALKNNDNKQLLLASIRKIALPSITIEESSQIVNLPKIDISKVILSDELTTELPPMLRIESGQLSNVSVSKSKTAIDTIAIGGLMIDTYINQTKALENLASIQSISPKDDKSVQANAEENENTQTEKVTPPAPNAKNNYQFVLNQFKFSDPAKIHLVDASIKPNYQRQYTIETFDVGPIDTHQPTQETVLTIKGYGDKDEKFNLKSVNQLFANKPSYSLKGDITEIDLSAISPYIKDALKHEIKSGQLNLSIDTKITDNILSGDTDILIRQIEFATQIAEAPDAVNTTASMPLNVALNMLKDSDGNVDLSIPLSGDISAPEFGLLNISTFLIKKASMMAAKDYLMKTFVPYANVVSIAMTAADAILKVRFNDLVYIPKQIEPTDTDTIFLSQFAQLLIDKPDTHVTICPIAVPEDINLKSGTKVTQPEQIEQLKGIAQKRFENFKKRMNQQYKIETSRLILCTPTIDSSESAKPRLSFAT